MPISERSEPGGEEGSPRAGLRWLGSDFTTRLASGLIMGALAAAALFAGPISGASMNPARSLAPALVGGRLGSLWVYLTAPFLGAVLAVLSCRCVQENPCCCTPVRESCS